MILVDLGTVILCICVDNMLVVGDKEAVGAFKREIKESLNTRKKGRLDKYVGCKVIRKDNNKLHMFQTDIMFKIEKTFGVDVREICKYWTPAAPEFAVYRPEKNKELIPANIKKHFRIAVGLMPFLIKFSCQDISNAVKELSKVNN